LLAACGASKPASPPRAVMLVYPAPTGSAPTEDPRLSLSCEAQCAYARRAGEQLVGCQEASLPTKLKDDEHLVSWGVACRFGPEVPAAPKRPR
jgi:hypothetical protein